MERQISALRSPKREEQSSSSEKKKKNGIMDELEGIEEGHRHHLHWEFMNWDDDEFSFREDEDQEMKVDESGTSLLQEAHFSIRSEEDLWVMNNEDEEGKESLKLSLNYQEVLDAWSDRGSLWANGYSLSHPNNSYMGEVPVMDEERARREASVLRYKEKRQSRLFSKKIRYQVRKLNADSRPRLKGRFVKRMSEKMLK